MITLDADEQLHCLRELLDTESTLPLDIRVAGALIMLYGPTTSQIHRLDATHITGCGEKWFLAIGRRPLLLPPPLARMLRGLADQPRRCSPLTVVCTRRSPLAR
ncbi:hypothetical protein [Nocardia barduliensis]|uniref:hypothetical protein n=1 Tax=Nocardia barduliensis TaxID=2736643 RepID=UPI001573A50D|nr:hypothetical protein [Nocardia barduliensis]